MMNSSGLSGCLRKQSHAQSNKSSAARNGDSASNNIALPRNVCSDANISTARTPRTGSNISAKTRYNNPAAIEAVATGMTQNGNPSHTNGTNASAVPGKYIGAYARSTIIPSASKNG